MIGRFIRRELSMFDGVRQSFAEVLRYAHDAPIAHDKALRDEKVRQDSAVTYWHKRYMETKKREQSSDHEKA